MIVLTLVPIDVNASVGDNVGNSKLEQLVGEPTDPSTATTLFGMLRQLVDGIGVGKLTVTPTAEQYASASLVEKVNYLQVRLEQVFQSASNGKSLIAGFLTNNGVTTANDATFATLQQNIGIYGNNLYNAGVNQSANLFGITCLIRRQYHAGTVLGLSRKSVSYSAPGDHCTYVLLGLASGDIWWHDDINGPATYFDVDWAAGIKGPDCYYHSAHYDLCSKICPPLQNYGYIYCPICDKKITGTTYAYFGDSHADFNSDYYTPSANCGFKIYNYYLVEYPRENYYSPSCAWGTYAETHGARASALGSCASMQCLMYHPLQFVFERNFDYGIYQHGSPDYGTNPYY